MSTTLCTCQKADPFKSIDQQIQKVIETRPKAADSTFGAAIAHLVRVYSGVKPLLTALASLPFIPANWRSVLTTFVVALDVVAAGAGDPNADFKAGKDL